MGAVIISTLSPNICTVGGGEKSGDRVWVRKWKVLASLVDSTSFTINVYTYIYIYN